MIRSGSQQNEFFSELFLSVPFFLLKDKKLFKKNKEGCLNYYQELVCGFVQVFSQSKHSKDKDREHFKDKDRDSKC